MSLAVWDNYSTEDRRKILLGEIASIALIRKTPLVHQSKINSLWESSPEESLPEVTLFTHPTE